MSLLLVENISKHFEGVRALNEVNFTVQRGEILAVIGPNGAGKTTLFNVLTKVFPATSGKVIFKDQDITNLKSHEIAKRGIARTFQHVHTLTDLTCQENVMTGCYRLTHTGLLESLLYLPKARREQQNSREKSTECLSLLGLKDIAGKVAGDQPYGTQKLLELARALVSDPELLLLDEPVATLNEAERELMSQLLYKLKKNGKTCILVEHQMEFVMKCSDRIVVLDYGVKLAEGTPKEIQSNPEVIAAYLGGKQGA